MALALVARNGKKKATKAKKTGRSRKAVEKLMDVEAQVANDGEFLASRSRIGARLWARADVADNVLKQKRKEKRRMKQRTRTSWAS